MTERLAHLLPSDVLGLYEVHSYRNAADVLASAYAAELDDLMRVAAMFRLTTGQIVKGGGNESEIPKMFAELLRPLGWFETKVQADLIVTEEMKVPQVDAKSGKAKIIRRETRKDRYLDGHKIDFVKNRVAFDLEWNSKDQTFDRDLYAFRAFFESGVIDVGVLVTRSASLNPVFRALGADVMKKYGASTTWMGKLLYRLEAGRNGGCPVLVLGITPALISDWQVQP